MTTLQIKFLNDLYIDKKIGSLEHIILGLILMSENYTLLISYKKLAEDLKRDKKNVYMSVLDLDDYITNERVGHKRRLSLREEFRDVE